MSRKITPIDTWVPWNPVIVKKHAPNWAAPQALPHVALLNARWSEDQSAAKPCQPPWRGGASNVSVRVDSVICFSKVHSGAFLRRGGHSLAVRKCAKSKELGRCPIQLGRQVTA